MGSRSCEMVDFCIRDVEISSSATVLVTFMNAVFVCYKRTQMKNSTVFGAGDGYTVQ